MVALVKAPEQTRELETLKPSILARCLFGTCVAFGTAWPGPCFSSLREREQWLDYVEVIGLFTPFFPPWIQWFPKAASSSTVLSPEHSSGPIAGPLSQRHVTLEPNSQCYHPDFKTNSFACLIFFWLALVHNWPSLQLLERPFVHFLHRRCCVLSLQKSLWYQILGKMSSPGQHHEQHRPLSLSCAGRWLCILTGLTFTTTSQSI